MFFVCSFFSTNNSKDLNNSNLVAFPMSVSEGIRGRVEMIPKKIPAAPPPLPEETAQPLRAVAALSEDQGLAT